MRDFLIDTRFANSRTSDDVELRPIEARFTSPVALRLVGLGVRNAGLLDLRRGPLDLGIHSCRQKGDQGVPEGLIRRLRAEDCARLPSAGGPEF